MTIRPAHPHEAEKLTALAIRSKAHWGYDDAFMRLAAEALTIGPQQIEAGEFDVLEEDGRAIGFYGLGGGPPTLVLDYLFVEPGRIGRGDGRTLWDHALRTARDRGARAIDIDSEPNAEGFYRARGAYRVGEAPSGVRGRLLPRLRYDVEEPAGAGVSGSDRDGTTGPSSAPPVA